MVKIEGTLDELRDLMGGASSAVRTVRSGTKKVVAAAKKTKRKVSAWQRYIGNRRNQIRFKSGAKKGLLNMKAMARKYKRSKK